jgi:RimJ/RimL family protein N-acetyltransferase
MKVNLRQADIGDLELMLAWRSDEEIYRHFRSQTEPLDWESHMSWFASRDSERCDWIVEYQGRRVGAVSLTPNNEIGIYIGEKSLWGEGVGSAALKQACDNTVKPISAEIHEDNTASQKLFKKVGFERIESDGEWIEYKLIES